MRTSEVGCYWIVTVSLHTFSRQAIFLPSRHEAIVLPVKNVSDNTSSSDFESTCYCIRRISVSVINL